MLKELHLINIILVESARILFDSGFNVLSGESGSGKSAIMNALNLIAGDRCDSNILRRGAEKGSVEAIFDIEQQTSLKLLLEESGINHETESELIIRREVSLQGKSRAFINNQQVQLTLLKLVTSHLFSVLGQHANQKLLSLDYHRQTIDLFGSIEPELKAFTDCWKQENQTRLTLENLINSEAKRIREIETCCHEIEELEKHLFKEGEEEELFAEYTTLSNAEELGAKAKEINSVLNGEKTGVLQMLSKQKSTIHQLSMLAPELKEMPSSYENALLELNEIARMLEIFEARIEYNPKRAEQLNERLEKITILKRKYGSSVESIYTYLKETKKRLEELENSDLKVEELKQQLSSLSKKSNDFGEALSKKRIESAKAFQSSILIHLRALNMPKAEFNVHVTPQKRSYLGDDKIEFFLSPNLGEHQIALKECASGGELSRLMLAIQTVLTGKEQTPTLVFDEIDSNIGGETALIVGEKISEICKEHQVLCITHFPQVASQAKHHLCVSKYETEDGRTLSVVSALNKEARDLELLRMLGGRAKTKI